MGFAIGQKARASVLGYGLTRAFSTGTGSTTVVAGGSGLMTFNQLAQNDNSEITVSGTNNTRFTFNVAGEYRYGFGFYGTHVGTSGSDGSRDFFLRVRLNGATDLVSRVQKMVVSAANILYVVSASSTRVFAQNDYIEVMMNNGFDVSVAEGTDNEVTHFFAKRTAGP